MKPDDLHLLLTREMPFGKYKGRVIADLPGHYLNWFAREGFPPGEIGRILALMQDDGCRARWAFSWSRVMAACFAKRPAMP